MRTRFCLTAALVLLANAAFAGHAVSLDKEPAVTAPAGPASGPPPQTNVKVTLPSELDVYLMESAMREVCDTFTFGPGDVRTECRREPIPIRAQNPSKGGVCITRYGNRVCY